MNTKNNALFQEKETKMEVAFLELLREKDFEHITVKDICRVAEVNRSTFYAHFLDMYDMLDKMQGYLHQELLAQFPDENSYDSMTFSSESFRIFLCHIRDHQFFYRIFLKTRTSFPIQEGYDLLMEQIVRPRCIAAGITDEQTMLYYLIGFQSSFTNILRHWVDEGCTREPEEITKIIQNCIPRNWQ